jgi:hypothetical protein
LCVKEKVDEVFAAGGDVDLSISSLPRLGRRR